MPTVSLNFFQDQIGKEGLTILGLEIYFYGREKIHLFRKKEKEEPQMKIQKVLFSKIKKLLQKFAWSRDFSEKR